jgi:ferrochelatase
MHAQADLMVAELERFRDPDGVEIFFSAHGVPTSYIEEAGDPYK